HSKPPRPQGAERNLVITSWEWGDPKTYLHDLISSDRRDPTVNANGPLLGSPEYASDLLPILDPNTNKVTTFKAPVRDPDAPEARRLKSRCSLRPIGARRSCGTPRSTTTTRCSIARAASGWRRRSAARTIQTSAKPDPTIRRPSCFRSTRICASSPYSTLRRC